MKRVFILSSQPLFGKGIESLLGSEKQVQIVGHVKRLDEGIQQIRVLHPDVVIVNSNDSELERVAVMLEVIKQELDVRVVTLNLRDNTAMICRGEQKVITGLSDFLDLVTVENGRQKPSVSVPRPDKKCSDRFGRTLDTLRISVTDRCNLNCIYCRPENGIALKPRNAILHSEEIARMVQAAVGIGFRYVRLTGGEPLLRKGIVGLVRRLVGIAGIEEVSLTTNATLLAAYARELADAGLRRVNISLDTLQGVRYRRLTRGGELGSVWRGIEAAQAAGLGPLKINTVVIRHVNDDELVDFARLTLDHPWHVRFTEVIPVPRALDWGEGMPRPNERLVTAAEMQERLQQSGRLIADPGPGGTGPARYYRLSQARGTIGFIAPISTPFCSSCNRIRLTADGNLVSCLFAEHKVPCKAALADGASLAELQALIRRAADLKPREHPSLDVGTKTGSAIRMVEE